MFNKVKLNQLYEFFSHLEWQLQTRFHGLTCGYEYWGARYIVGVCGTIMADKEAFKKKYHIKLNSIVCCFMNVIFILDLLQDLNIQ